jgi:alkylation response protein AidB-like acyl-CoA dehydrogenase
MLDELEERLPDDARSYARSPPEAIFDRSTRTSAPRAGTFLDKEVVPTTTSGRRTAIVDREVWRKAGAQGLLGFDVDEEYGGGGTRLPLQRRARRGDDPARRYGSASRCTTT